MSATQVPGQQNPSSSHGSQPQEVKRIADRDSVRASALLQQIDRLLRQSERLVWIHAISTWLIISILSLGILVVSDIFFRWQEPGMRWLCWTLWATATIGSGIWWMRRAWRFVSLSKPQRRERMGLQIERLFPQARYEVASAISFAQQIELPSTACDSSLMEIPGSDKLKHESIQRCQQILTKLPLEQTIDRRQPLVQLALFLALACAASSALFVAPSSWSLATQRLLAPWQPLNWPRLNQLKFVDLPKVVAAGEDLSLRVIDENEQLPATVQLEVQWPQAEDVSEPARSETLEMKIVDSLAQLTLPGASLTPEGSRNRLKLRAKGGDDQSMPWQDIVIADVPQLRSFAIRVDPPAYSGQASTEVSGQSIRVLAGSRVSIHGEWTAFVQSASIDRWNAIPSAIAGMDPKENIKSAERATAAAEAPILELSNNSSSFSLGLNQAAGPLGIGSSDSKGVPIYQSTEIAIRWKSVDGLDVVGPKWTIQTIDDRPPTIELLKPLDEQPVTPNATLPLAANVADDLGLQSISLHWKWIGSKGAEVARDSEQESLWNKADSENATASGSLLLAQRIEQEWSIPATALAQGVTGLTLWLEAKDNADQTAQSKSITLRFTTPEQTLAELAESQTDVRNKIEQALQQQREAALPVKSSLGVLQQNSELQQEDRDALQSAARNQKNLRTVLTQDRNSIKASLGAIAEQLKANNLDDSELARENQDLLDRIAELDATDLSTAQQAVARASQLANDAARSETSDGLLPPLVEQLTESNTAQTKIIDSLQQMLDSLSRTESLRQSQSELMDIARKQRELHERTEQLQRSTLLAPNSAGLNSERTRIEVAQSELARETERIQQQLREDSLALQEKTPQLAANSTKLANELADAELSSKMREVKDAVQNNDFDNAVPQQLAIMDSLENILEQSSRSSQPTLEQLEQALNGAQQAISNIAAQQQSLSDSIADRNDSNDSKREEQMELQSQLRADTEQMVQQLEDWLGKNSLEDMLQAVEDQQNAESSLQADNQPEAEQAAQDAASRLQRTADMLEDMKLEVQQENIADQLQRLRPLVDRLYSEEANLATDSRNAWEQIEPELKDSLANRGEIRDRPQEAFEQTAREYAARQLALRQLLARNDGEFKVLPAFELITEAILADMDQAVAGFERRQFTETAMPAVDAAQRRLKQLQEAIAESKSPEEETEPNQEPDPEPTEDTERQVPSRAPLASLKLLRSLQQDLLRETNELAQTSLATELTPTQQRRLNQLADLQQKLAEQVEKLADEMRREPNNANSESP